MEISIDTPFWDSMHPPVHHLAIDGRRPSGVHVSNSGAGFLINATSAEAANILRQIPLAAFPSTVCHVEVPLSFEWRDFKATAAADIKDGRAHILFKFKPDLLAWTGPVEFERLTDAIRELALDTLPGLELVAIDGETGAFSFRTGAKKGLLGSTIDSWFAPLAALRDQVESRIQTLEGLTLSFKFPPEVKVACEQYLLYFAEFLADLGVKAHASLREEAGTILFSVVPDDSRHALSIISEALALYLALPASRFVEEAADEAIEILKLRANVHHLKGQLGLAKALLRAQAATVNAQEIALEAQKRLLSPEVLRPATTDREEFFGGTMALTRYEGKGFEISLAEIFRRLKARFRP